MVFIVRTGRVAGLVRHIVVGRGAAEGSLDAGRSFEQRGCELERRIADFFSDGSRAEKNLGRHYKPGLRSESCIAEMESGTSRARCGGAVGVFRDRSQGADFFIWRLRGGRTG